MIVTVIYYLGATSQERRNLVMPVIGFEDEVVEKKELTEEAIQQREKEIEESQNQFEREEIKLSQRKLESLREIYSEVVVHDYGDGYHKTEEELDQENVFYGLYRKIQGKKKGYGRIPEFIDATRNCLAFLNAVAENQHVYSKEKFLYLWAKGKIRINGMYLPVYKGKDRKRISGKSLAEFILSDADPQEFLQELEAPIIDSEEMLDEQRTTMFTQSDYDQIFSHTEEEMDEITGERIIDESKAKTYSDLPIATDLGHKGTKQLLKANPGLSSLLREAAKRNRMVEGYSDQMIYNLEEDDMETIAAYDRAYGVKSSSDIPEFKGSLMSKSDYEDYLAELEEWEMKNVKVKQNGKWRTKEEANELSVKDILERNGWNIMKLWNNSEREQKLRKFIKQEKKREERLREELASLDKRRERQKEEGRSDLEEYKRLMKKKKKKEDKTNKSTKAKKDKDKNLEKAVKKKKQRLDEVLLGEVTTNDFDKYEAEALDWSWSKIKGGKES